MTRGTGVPTHVMQLIANARHFQAVDHLGIGRTFGIRIHRGKVVRLLDASPSVDRDGVEQFLTWRFDRLSRAGVARPATGPVHGRAPPLILPDFPYNEKICITK